MKRARVVGTGTTAARFPAQLLPASRHFIMNGQCFAYHGVEEPRDLTVPVYRTGGRG